jgi:Mor family transcriptional regulator
MVEMIEVIEHSVNKEIDRDASPKHLAQAAVVAVCSVMGGMSIYLPRGDALKRELRDEALHQDHIKGLTIIELVRKYRVGQQHVYTIINNKMRLNLNTNWHSGD